jgi:hypothetical protein
MIETHLSITTKATRQDAQENMRIKGGQKKIQNVTFNLLVRYQKSRQRKLARERSTARSTECPSGSSAFTCIYKHCKSQEFKHEVKITFQD